MIDDACRFLLVANFSVCWKHLTRDVVVRRQVG